MVMALTQTSGEKTAITGAAAASTEPKKLKPCCACPETKKVRDKCIIENGEVNCNQFIEAHKDCMRKMGFNI